ncbi:hypothetical protein, partial [Rickettsia endosymbiont of Ixodes scapularis]|uniref:hypothetical protein n=1 Tax=Rickettsia endosymbiont of Ixodes scapularis TaxID=444612 RepID=UPI0019D6AEF6
EYGKYLSLKEYIEKREAKFQFLEIKKIWGSTSEHQLAVSMNSLGCLMEILNMWSSMIVVYYQQYQMLRL